MRPKGGGHEPHQTDFPSHAMLIYRRTSLLESNAQTLVNTVNCVGVMGKGLAQAFKGREPEMFAAYKRICDGRKLEPGKLWLWRGSESWILNFPTKMHWRNPSKLEWIEAGLTKFAAAYEEQGIAEISFPKLGCGNGNLDWADVQPVMEHYLAKLPIKIYIHDFTKDIGLPEHLEAIAEAVRLEQPCNPSFEGFLQSLQRVVDLGGEQLVELDSKVPFRAHMSPSADLEVETGDFSWRFEEEVLRGVWLELQSGVVTKERAGWAERDAGTPLLSILSLLPGLRPIEIQRRGASAPEIAVERTPASRVLASALQSANQHAFAWH